MIGSFGDVVFSVSHETVRTFSDYSRSTAGRWASHEVLGLKPLPQYIGPGLDTITFNMRFDANLGVNPRKEMDRLIMLDRKAKAVSLIIGGKGIGTGLWVITSLSQTYDTVDNKGNIIAGNMSITLQEYPVSKQELHKELSKRANSNKQQQPRQLRARN